MTQQKQHYIAGVDEVGRGCLAGPVVAVAVILPVNVRIEGVTDSKKLSATQREALAPQIRACAISVGIGICTPEEIDKLNILWASLEAMRRAVEALSPQPDFLKIDGNRGFSPCDIPFETIVKGDLYDHSIGCASILAKVYRDDLMAELHQDFPVYHWDKNKGYGTLAHYSALEKFGETPHHRQSFRLKPVQAQQLDLGLRTM